ncbi:MAG: hypothetical protein KGI71_06195 [Patescibacteria group bacterium]|nr:hypothetical protein [Patescibacteria group bacterium]
MKNTKTQELLLTQRVETADAVIRALISTVGLSGFASGLNNALFHGDILEKNDIEFTDEQLSELYDGIDRFAIAARKITG